MHVELPLECITATISVTPSLISELIRLLSNGREGRGCAQLYGKKMSWMYVEYGVKTFHSIWEFTIDRSTHSFCFTAGRLNIILFSEEWHSFHRREFNLKFRLCHSQPTESYFARLFCLWIRIKPKQGDEITFLKLSSHHFTISCMPLKIFPADIWFATWFKTTHQHFSNITDTKDAQSGFTLIVVAWMTWVVGQLWPWGGW